MENHTEPPARLRLDLPWRPHGGSILGTCAAIVRRRMGETEYRRRKAPDLRAYARVCWRNCWRGRLSWLYVVQPSVYIDLNQPPFKKASTKPLTDKMHTQTPYRKPWQTENTPAYVSQAHTNRLCIYVCMQCVPVGFVRVVCML